VVKTARETPGPRALLPLNQPMPLRVEVEDGWPVAVHTKSGPDASGVAATEDVWRVEEEWWRDAPIIRTYFEVLLETGRRMTLFFDHASSSWFWQRHA
jgi:hypothetical protein